MISDDEKPFGDKLLSAVDKVFIFTEDEMFNTMEECKSLSIRL